MKYLLFLILFDINSEVLFPQEISILYKNDKSISPSIDRNAPFDSKKFPHYFGWQVLDSQTNLQNLYFVATIEIRAKKRKDGSNFLLIDKKLSSFLNNVDANLISLKNFDFTDSSKFFTLTLDLYFGDDSIASVINKKKPTNVVYLFPYLEKPRKWTGFLVNGKRIKIGFRECFKYSIAQNDEVRIQKSLDNDIIVRWDNTGVATYLIPGGLTVYPHISTGVFSISQGMGELLTKTIFNKQIMN